MKRDLPCSDCGEMMWRGRGSRPEGQATCHPCRRVRRTQQAAQAPPAARRPTQRRCEICEAPLDSKNQSKQRTCSRACGVVLRRQATGSLPERWPASSVVIVDCRACGQPFNRRGNERRIYCGRPCDSRYKVKAGSIETLRCRTCSASFPHLFAGPGNRPHVCAACRAGTMKEARRQARRTRRARLRGATRQPYRDRDIFERDQWRCQLCGTKVLRSRSVPHDKAPTIDHIVPLSKGGDDVPANIFTAHFGCNVRKGDRGGGEQLALLG